MRIPVNEQMTGEWPANHLVWANHASELDRLVWRINCSLGTSTDSLIAIRNTVQNGSLPETRWARDNPSRIEVVRIHLNLSHLTAILSFVKDEPHDSSQ